jgi:hypothetical protein
MRCDGTGQAVGSVGEKAVDVEFAGDSSGVARLFTIITAGSNVDLSVCNRRYSELHGEASGISRTL